MQNLRGIIMLLSLLETTLLGLDVTINYGKEKGENFSVLNIAHKESLECNEKRNPQNEVLYVVCSLARTPLTSFSPTETLFFRFWSRVVDGIFYLYVEPKHRIKLFATPQDLKNGRLITKEQPKRSKSWQVVGYINDIPFLSESATQLKSKGINFPIKIIKNEEIFFGDLDVDRGPLRYDEYEDFETYMQIKNAMGAQNYIQAIKLIDETLINYPNSIFTKDLLLWRLRALEHFDSVENSDMIVDLGIKWIKKYPTDANVPEVLYYLGNAYADMRIPEEAKYYFERTINEYPQSRYMPLSKMALAKNFNVGQDTKVASKLFSQAYQEAKDLDSASAIAMEWSNYHLLKHEKSQAQRLLEAMVKANPQYITKYPLKSYEFLKTLAENDIPLIAAKLGEYLYEVPSDDINKEELLDNVSLWYQNGGAAESKSLAS